MFYLYFVPAIILVFLGDLLPARVVYGHVISCYLAQEVPERARGRPDLVSVGPELYLPLGRVFYLVPVSLPGGTAPAPRGFGFGFGFGVFELLAAGLLVGCTVYKMVGTILFGLVGVHS